MSVLMLDKLTVADFRAQPEGTFCQLIEGELFMSPAPNLYHQSVLKNLFRIIDRHLQKNPGGQVFFAPVDLYLDEENAFQPDLLYVSPARASILQEDGVHGAPDLVVEILSPSNAMRDKKTKRLVYARHGVVELWLVNPMVREACVYRLQEQPDKPVGRWEEEESFTSGLFPGLTISLAEVFQG